MACSEPMSTIPSWRPSGVCVCTRTLSLANEEKEREREEGGGGREREEGRESKRERGDPTPPSSCDPGLGLPDGQAEGVGMTKMAPMKKGHLVLVLILVLVFPFFAPRLEPILIHLCPPLFLRRVC